MRAMGARNQAARGRVVLRYAVAASERRPPDRPFEVARLHDLLHGRQIASMTPKNEPNDRASQASVAAAHSSVAWLRLCCALLLRGRPGLASSSALRRATKGPRPVAPRINKRVACSDRGADWVVQKPHCTRLFCIAAQSPRLSVPCTRLCVVQRWSMGPRSSCDASSAPLVGPRGWLEQASRPGGRALPWARAASTSREAEGSAATRARTCCPSLATRFYRRSCRTELLVSIRESATSIFLIDRAPGLPRQEFPAGHRPFAPCFHPPERLELGIDS